MAYLRSGVACTSRSALAAHVSDLETFHGIASCANTPHQTALITKPVDFYSRYKPVRGRHLIAEKPSRPMLLGMLSCLKESLSHNVKTLG